MSTTYLFRVDGAKDNDAFFAAMRSSVCQVCAGVDFHVGAGGWIPDLVKVVVEESTGRCSLTLIELEATETVALISCRKYLPENSSVILSAFSNYLDRVIRQCRSTADARESEFVQLKTVLSQAGQVKVTAAGALRSSIRFVEELPLIDQPECATQVRLVRQDRQDSALTFHGILKLTRLEAEALARCVMVLDAVIRKCDHSGTRFELWRRRTRSQPLKRLLTQSNGSHPELRSLVFNPKHAGVTLDFEQVLSALIVIWSSDREKPLDREQGRGFVSRYFPVASGIKGHESMTAVFEAARKLVSGAAI